MYKMLIGDYLGEEEEFNLKVWGRWGGGVGFCDSCLGHREDAYNPYPKSKWARACVSCASVRKLRHRVGAAPPWGEAFAFDLYSGMRHLAGIRLGTAWPWV